MVERLVAIGAFGMELKDNFYVELYQSINFNNSILGLDYFYIKVESQFKIVKFSDYRVFNNKLFAHVSGVESSNISLLYNLELFILKKFFVNLKYDFYWIDLIGINVFNSFGSYLGRVINIFSTGANDVILVKYKYEYCIPFIYNSFILSVDLLKKKIVVLWDVLD